MMHFEVRVGASLRFTRVWKAASEAKSMLSLLIPRVDGAEEPRVMG